MERVDAVVLGGGPSGLGAALALARSGVTVLLAEAAERVGGLCVTLRRDGFAYDLGGHIPFVRDDARRAWLDDLLGGRMRWVARPVSCVIDGEIHAGRYLDQRPAAPDRGAEPDGSAYGELASRFGGAFVDATMRPYLEKIDGVPLERIPGPRALKLMNDQAAPRGFWFPDDGIGALMDAMADAVRRLGGEVALEHRADAIEVGDGRVTGVRLTGDSGVREIAADAVVVGIPAARAAALVTPAAPSHASDVVRMRAVCIVYLEIDLPEVGHDAWVQVDDPEVPFARAFEPRNWSTRLSPPGRTMLGLECYCSPEPADPVWGLDDDALAARCAWALSERLGWIDAAERATLMHVVRMPRAYPVPDIAQIDALAAPMRVIEGIAGLHHAPGAAVIEAIEAGERAAARVVADGRAAA